ncbi:MAG: hypothetical protein HY717_01830 [Planctomycetes bacterium]|nr:hypothetical protein [Planctomycetota bacterium]
MLFHAVPGHSEFHPKFFFGQALNEVKREFLSPAKTPKLVFYRASDYHNWGRWSIVGGPPEISRIIGRFLISAPILTNP